MTLKREWIICINTSAAASNKSKTEQIQEINRIWNERHKICIEKHQENSGSGA